MSSSRTTYLVAITLSAGIALSLTGSAQADPVEDLERQLELKWQASERTIEEFNKNFALLQQTKAEAEKVSAKIQPLQDKVDAAYAEVGALASAAYRGGKVTITNALLGGGSTTSVLEQLTMMTAISAKEQRQIDELNHIKAPLDAEKQKLQQLLEEQQRKEAELSKLKAEITKDMAELQEQRRHAYIDRASRAGQRVTYVPQYVPGPPGKAINYALAQLGKPYIWAAEGPEGFDCSGLTLKAWQAAGVYIGGHYTTWQLHNTDPVSRANAKPGDLVFFGGSNPHHVGLYLGDGKMVHAPTFGQPVQIASIDSLGDLSGFGRPRYKVQSASAAS